MIVKCAQCGIYCDKTWFQIKECARCDMPDESEEIVILRQAVFCCKQCARQWLKERLEEEGYDG